MDGTVRRITVLGSTGSIGTNVLEVAGMLAGRIEVVGMSTNRNVGLLADQVRVHAPLAVAVADGEADLGALRALPGVRPRVFTGAGGLVGLAEMPEADLVVNALVGASGIEPTLAAIAAGKDVAIANKECLVSAGEIIVREASLHGVELVPVDSEHSAVYQCIRCEKKAGIKRIVLTASGGPFVDMSAGEIAGVRALDALKHPTWTMGKKVTIDSATLLNKGFEVIEAHWLFGVDAERITVLVERKSVVHSLVEFVDGSVVALFSVPDMRLPIQYALTYPDRVETGLPRLDLKGMGGLSFEEPDRRKFPCLDLAFEAVGAGGTAPAVLSAADEVVVEGFLSGAVRFGDIYPLLRDVLRAHRPTTSDSLENVMEADRWAREEARRFMGETGGPAGAC
jgi:1-deoxy-D-xylulose-5-phosphate reductoisomerase